jgi:hypothetical protein
LLADRLANILVSQALTATDKIKLSAKGKYKDLVVVFAVFFGMMNFNKHS